MSSYFSNNDIENMTERLLDLSDGEVNLNHYISTQKTHFDNGFEFKIVVDKRDDLENALTQAIDEALEKAGPNNIEGAFNDRVLNGFLNEIANIDVEAIKQSLYNLKMDMFNNPDAARSYEDLANIASNKPIDEQDYIDDRVDLDELGEIFEPCITIKDDKLTIEPSGELIDYLKSHGIANQSDYIQKVSNQMDTGDDSLVPLLRYYDEGSILYSEAHDVIFYKSGFDHPSDDYELNFQSEYFYDYYANTPLNDIKSDLELTQHTTDFFATPFMSKEPPFCRDMIESILEGEAVEFSVDNASKEYLAKYDLVSRVQAMYLKIIDGSDSFPTNYKEDILKAFESKSVDLSDKEKDAITQQGYIVGAFEECESDYLLKATAQQIISLKETGKLDEGVLAQIKADINQITATSDSATITQTAAKKHK